MQCYKDTRRITCVLHTFVVGAADFLPDIVTDSPAKTSGCPKYAEFGSLMRKINTWLDKVKVGCFHFFI